MGIVMDGGRPGQRLRYFQVSFLGQMLAMTGTAGQEWRMPQFHAEFGVRELGRLPNHPCLTRPRLVILIKAVRAHDENSNSVRDQPSNGRILHCRRDT
jgi:hypothetical protein